MIVDLFSLALLVACVLLALGVLPFTAPVVAAMFGCTLIRWHVQVG
jgi:hypothetical protein